MMPGNGQSAKAARKAAAKAAALQVATPSLRIPPPRKLQNPPQRADSEHELFGFGGDFRSGGMLRDLVSMSPLDPRPIPVLRHEATALVVPGVARLELSHQLLSRTVYMVTNVGNAGTIACRLASSLGFNMLTVPVLALTDDAGGPVSGRAMKAGVTVVNNTADINAGGRVYVLNSDQRVPLAAAPSAATAPQVTAFMDTIVNHPATRSFSGKDFQSPKHFHCHAVDNVDYEDYTPWAGTLTLNEFMEHVAVWPGSSHGRRPMSCVFIVLEAPPFVQDYTMSANSYHYTRWPLSSIGGSVARDVPVAPAAVVGAILKTGMMTSDPQHAMNPR